VKWKGETPEQKKERETAWRTWHTIFAFLPHKTYEGPWIWLQKLERRAYMITGLGPHWEYREKQ
jgi:hypothetical protein